MADRLQAYMIPPENNMLIHVPKKRSKGAARRKRILKILKLVLLCCDDDIPTYRYRRYRPFPSRCANMEMKRKTRNIAGHLTLFLR